MSDERAPVPYLDTVSAIGAVSAELAARADAWNGNAPDWFPEPPEWLELWDKALAGQWTPDTFADFKKLLAAVEALDAKLGQPDCEDPAKAAWMREVEARLKKLEGS